MLHAQPPAPTTANDDDIIVRAPQAADTLSLTLRTAFDHVHGLPDDWRSMLAELDRVRPCAVSAYPS